MEKFNYFRLITNRIIKAQENIKEPGDITIVIDHSKETRGNIYVSNCDPKKGKKFPRIQSEMMTEIFKQLIIEYGAAITEIELMVPRRNRLDRKLFVPVLFGVNYININSNGEGKFLARSKEYAKQYIPATPDMGFPFSYKLITQVAIDLKHLENIWITNQEKKK